MCRGYHKRMTRQEIEHEIVSLVAQARSEGWYEDDPSWDEVDERLSRLGRVAQ